MSVTARCLLFKHPRTVINKNDLAIEPHIREQLSYELLSRRNHQGNKDEGTKIAGSSINLSVNNSGTFFSVCNKQMLLMRINLELN